MPSKTALSLRGIEQKLIRNLLDWIRNKSTHLKSCWFSACFVRCASKRDGWTLSEALHLPLPGVKSNLMSFNSFLAFLLKLMKDKSRN